jgi:hypothetical protein
LEALLARREFPAYRGTQIDLDAVAVALGTEVMQLLAVKSQLHPIFDAVARAVTDAELRPRTKDRIDREGNKSVQGSMKRPGRRPKAIVEFPQALETTRDEPDGFGAALRLHAAWHGETICHLYDAVVRSD